MFAVFDALTITATTGTSEVQSNADAFRRVIVMRGFAALSTFTWPLTIVDSGLPVQRNSSRQPELSGSCTELSEQVGFLDAGDGATGPICTALPAQRAAPTSATPSSDRRTRLRRVRILAPHGFGRDEPGSCGRKSLDSSRAVKTT